MTERIDRLASLLLAEKGFQRTEPDLAALARGDQDVVERSKLLAEVLAEPPLFDFVGTCGIWWGRAQIALVDANRLDLAGMERFAARFFALVFADRGMSEISYGTLCFVFQRPPNPAISQYIRNLKRSARANKVWIVAWTVDLSTGRVIPHRLWPWGLYPGRAYIEGAIRRS